MNLYLDTPEKKTTPTSPQSIVDSHKQYFLDTFAIRNPPLKGVIKGATPRATLFCLKVITFTPMSVRSTGQNFGTFPDILERCP